MSSSPGREPITLASVKGHVRGIFYCAVWSVSIAAGFYFLFAPLLILLFLNRSLYRKISDIIFSAWEAFNVSMLEIFFGMKTFISGRTFEYRLPIKLRSFFLIVIVPF